jgi:hypothetical protein
MDIIPAVANDPNYIINAEFVKLTIYNSTDGVNVTTGNEYTIQVSGNTNWTSIGANSNIAGTTFTATGNGSGNGYAWQSDTYTFSSAYQYETINGVSYTPLGGLLAVGVQQRDIRVTSADTSISLSGIAGNNIQLVLDNTIKGSKLEIIRGFYDNNFVLTSNAHRFTGIVTSYNISEERQEKDDNFTVTLNASSYKAVLSNRTAGRRTNMQSWQVTNPTDSSMNNVYSIADTQFDFGKKPGPTRPNPSCAGLDQNLTNDSTQNFEQP